MAKFFILCGLPGSGKSFIAEKLKRDENALIFSSDAIRAELYGSEEDQAHNGEVFVVLHKRLTQALHAGKNVIYDATNISAKRRSAFLKQLKGIECEKIAVYLDTPIELCIARNAKRARHVPENVIRNMYNNFTKPTLAEGFDNIIVIKP